MKELEFMQQTEKLNQISNHVKSQLSFYALENERKNKVHFLRITPFINRLLNMETFGDTVNLFNKDASETIAQQLLNVLSSLGEIAKLPGGYYLPLPERVVELPMSKKKVLLSSRKQHENIDYYLGWGSGYSPEQDNLPKMTMDEWMPSIDVTEFLQIIKQSHPYEIKDNPAQIFIANEKREWVSYEKIENCHVDTFIARYYAAQGPANYYWVKKRKNKVNYYAIPNYYVDMAKFALEKQAGVSRTVDCLEIDNKFFKANFSYRISIAERKMLMLFAFPENVYDPFQWIIPTIHYEDFVYIIDRLGMQVRNSFLSNI